MPTDWAAIAKENAVGVAPMIKVIKLISDLTKHGATVTADGPNLKVNGKPLTDDLRQRVRDGKADLLIHLGIMPRPSEPWDEPTARKLVDRALQLLHDSDWSHSEEAYTAQAAASDSIDDAWMLQDMTGLRKAVDRFIGLLERKPLPMPTDEPETGDVAMECTFCKDKDRAKEVLNQKGKDVPF